MPEVIIKTEPTGPNAPPVVDPNAQVATRPEHVPEKFWKDGKVDVDGLAKSYVELEKKQSTPPPKVETAPPADPKLAIKTVTDAGFDPKALVQEFTANGGKLTDETLTKLAAKGVTKEFIDSYMAGQKARASEIVSEVTKAAGGADKLSDIYKWAEAELSKEDIESYNEIMETGNARMSKLAFEGLLARYNAANGKDPALITSEATPVAQGAQPYANSAQVVTAMKDPRYNTDEAYRQEVYKRLAVTPMFGVR